MFINSPLRIRTGEETCLQSSQTWHLFITQHYICHCSLYLSIQMYRKDLIQQRIYELTTHFDHNDPPSTGAPLSCLHIFSLLSFVFGNILQCLMLLLIYVIIPASISPSQYSHNWVTHRQSDVCSNFPVRTKTIYPNSSIDPTAHFAFPINYTSSDGLKAISVAFNNAKLH